MSQPHGAWEWLDPQRLGTNLLRANQRLIATKYFTARIAASPRDPDKHRRQGVFLEAIETLPQTRIYYGQYLRKQQQCFSCETTWVSSVPTLIE